MHSAGLEWRSSPLDGRPQRHGLLRVASGSGTHALRGGQPPVTAGGSAAGHASAGSPRPPSPRVSRPGTRVPSGRAEWFPQRVLALPLPGRLRFEVAPLLAVMRHLPPPLAYSDERTAALTATDERVWRLQSVPNV